VSAQVPDELVVLLVLVLVLVLLLVLELLLVLLPPVPLELVLVLVEVDAVPPVFELLVEPPVPGSSLRVGKHATKRAPGAATASAMPASVNGRWCLVGVRIRRHPSRRRRRRQA
jgi:hypothetical protein